MVLYHSNKKKVTHPPIPIIINYSTEGKHIKYVPYSRKVPKTGNNVKNHQ